MKLIVQPENGTAPILKAIRQAQRSIEIVIFRFDRPEIQKALEAAVGRGVVVRTLIAHTNKGGKDRLRKLELKLLAAGVTVARTADDLVRYHGKLMICDREALHVYGFNLTRLDIEKSRSFGIVTKNRRLVQEAVRLFEADASRQPFRPTLRDLVVSPENARDRLASFIRKARRELLIYDPKVADPSMMRLLYERAKAGVSVRVIGKVGKRAQGLSVAKFPGKRLHVRAIIRDGRRAFVGSQSLRRLELDERREVGLVIRDVKTIRQMTAIFEADWAQTDVAKEMQKEQVKKEKKEEKTKEEKPKEKKPKEKKEEKAKDKKEAGERDKDKEKEQEKVKSDDKDREKEKERKEA
jgi:phosphatidylserine/phosphatidylglycerophosphate/cardiolipin synthase-like enzyme